METLEKLISINTALNRQAKFFGFMPISQVMPLGVIAFFCFLIVGAAGGKDKHFGIAFGFMTGTWLLATGAHPHHMTDRMRPFQVKIGLTLDFLMYHQYPKTDQPNYAKQSKMTN
ncbi:MAG: hypothetical protein HC930_12680 [Hydrococcus sp. SU_1_0]|nr:hypothetical protein [Hydrococcus sp. SU_1_0]